VRSSKRISKGDWTCDIQNFLELLPWLEPCCFSRRLRTLNELESASALELDRDTWPGRRFARMGITDITRTPARRTVITALIGFRAAYLSEPARGSMADFMGVRDSMDADFTVGLDSQGAVASAVDSVADSAEARCAAEADSAVDFTEAQCAAEADSVVDPTAADVANVCR
jgi:hypothetical protein